MGSAKLKKTNTAEKFPPFLRQHGRALLALLVLVLLVHDIFGTHGFLAMRRKQLEIKKVTTDLDQLNKENLQLEQEVRELKTDPRKIEKIARDELGLQARRGHHQDPAGAAVAAGFFCKALTRHFFHVVRARESPSIARKIVISPAVALSALHCPFGKMENLP